LLRKGKVILKNLMENVLFVTRQGTQPMVVEVGLGKC
jgi:hypothetical protein